MKNNPDITYSEPILDDEINDFGLYGTNFSDAERFAYGLFGGMVAGRRNLNICHINASNAKLPVFLAEISLDSFKYNAYYRDKSALLNAQMDYGSFSFRADLLAIEMDFNLMNEESRFSDYDYTLVEMSHKDNFSAGLQLMMNGTARYGTMAICRFKESPNKKTLEKLINKFVDSGINPASISQYNQNETAVIKFEV